MASHGSEPKKEDAMTVVAIMLGSAGILLLLFWLSSSVKIVNFWSPKFVTMARMWLWIPGEYAQLRYDEVALMSSVFLHNPKAVSVFDWLSFVNKSARLPTILMTLVVTGMLARVLLKGVESVKRAFKPQQLAVHLSHVFTGIAPVLHLRKAIANDKEPYWRRQLFPHEALLNVKVYGKPMIVDGKIEKSRLEDYFRGIVKKKVAKSDLYPAGLAPVTIEGRLVSRMLGRQVVDLTADGGKNINFVGRFSIVGQVIYALLCAHAFGGEEGKKDYAKARDQLNNSCRGAAHGIANLTVATWLYDKYKSNPMARKLFAVHHWEYTYLFELLLQAKRQGKCGHWEFMWLKPTNRILFYVMNTVGRFTPHTESAAVFSQYIYERRVARPAKNMKHGRLPLKEGLDGKMHHVIYIEKAVKGLSLEWDRWKDGEEDENLWWTDPDVWKSLSGVHLDSASGPPPAGISENTKFDTDMSAQARASAQRLTEEQMAATAAAMSSAGKIDWQ